jgi:hypothetical protein
VSWACKPSIDHEGSTYKNTAFFAALFSRSRLRFFSRASSLLAGIALLVSRSVEGVDRRMTSCGNTRQKWMLPTAKKEKKSY